MITLVNDVILISVLLGYSTVGVSPCPHFRPRVYPATYLGKEVRTIIVGCFVCFCFGFFLFVGEVDKSSATIISFLLLFCVCLFGLCMFLSKVGSFSFTSSHLENV